MSVYGFSKEKAVPGHNGTILASPVIEGGMHEPFAHAWGYLDTPSEMEPHTHDTYEVYIVVQGEGFAVIEGERFPVKAGDVVNILPGKVHTMVNERNAPLQWAAFWWESRGQADA